MPARGSLAGEHAWSVAAVQAGPRRPEGRQVRDDPAVGGSASPASRTSPVRARVSTLAGELNRSSAGSLPARRRSSGPRRPPRRRQGRPWPPIPSPSAREAPRLRASAVAAARPGREPSAAAARRVRGVPASAANRVRQDVPGIVDAGHGGGRRRRRRRDGAASPVADTPARSPRATRCGSRPGRHRGRSRPRPPQSTPPRLLSCRP